MSIYSHAGVMLRLGGLLAAGTFSLMVGLGLAYRLASRESVAEASTAQLVLILCLLILPGVTLSLSRASTRERAARPTRPAGTEAASTQPTPAGHQPTRQPIPPAEAA